MRTLMGRLAGAAASVAMVVAFPLTANAAEKADVTPAPTTYASAASVATDPGLRLTGDQAGERATAAPPVAKKPATAQASWYYHITSSCRGYENSIVRGADYWGGGVRTTSSGTPVSCTSGYVQGCGISNAVGCNWNQGGRIALSSMVRDMALLAAHEFGHNWYGHSAQGCASWNSAYDVMKTTMC
ncbi:hypothetical protein [Streptomyces zagrosensis]|uniref:Uncharacterized protein n=1 Tax=Streptomyces zagrosensis TaxID=1042984 RepID=A0A7W9UXK3_9ACTN|nr:hypothetical protein [Streptomyces zagrosensis]MBB5934965.1 hypothetical protein [Streptomyces zagrosensis]